MAEPFKNPIDARLVREAATHLQRVHREFETKRFVSLATRGLDRLEMKARAMQICDAFEATLPADFDAAAAVIEAALAPAHEDEDLGAMQSAMKMRAQGLAGWILWAVGEFVARRGLDQPVRALATLRELTMRFSAEFAIRPFIVAHPALAFETLARWARDPNVHVRRLVSEGSRPRLPWGLRLAALVADPSPALPLLRVLQDDPSEYVRRSVANHLNDIAKDHPALVVQWVREHLPEASAERRALLHHASRSLVKQGHAPMLALWGLGAPFRGDSSLKLAPARVALGEALTIELVLHSRARSAQRLLIDYAVHHVKANGAITPKVFKGWTLELPAHGELSLSRRHSMRPVTTRRYHAGRHLVSVHINGRSVAEAAFMLEM